MKTTLKLSFRRPLFALLPLLMGLSSVSAAPRAGVAVAYTGMAIPAVGAVPATTMKDFFQICTNNNGECAFEVLGANGKKYLMSNGGLGRTAAPVVIRQANSSLICLQNNGKVNSVSNGRFFNGADTLAKLEPFAGSLGAVSLAEDAASFLSSASGPSGSWGSFSYRYSVDSLGYYVESTFQDSTFTSASVGRGSVFLRRGGGLGPVPNSYTSVYTSNGLDRYQASVNLYSGVATPAISGTPELNGFSPLGNGPLLADVPDYSTPGAVKYTRKMLRANGQLILTVGGTFAGVTITAIPQLGSEANGIPVFLAKLGFGQFGVIRGGPPTVLLKTGDSAPGISGATISSIEKFDLDQGGNCVIHAKIGGTEALYRSTRGSAPVLFAQMWDTITVNGQTRMITGFELQSVLNRGVSIGPRGITSNGRVAAYVKFGNDRAAFVFDAQ